MEPSNLDREIEWLNSIAKEALEEQLLKCCGSTNWARRMAEECPFVSFEDLLTSADRIWWSLNADDWLEAFRSHPKIGEQKAVANISSDAQKWSKQEQASIGDAAPDTKRELALLNHEYEQKFGFIYIVCATGKSSEEMLEILKNRMDNSPDEELRIAAAEQAKITQLRLKKLMES